MLSKTLVKKNHSSAHFSGVRGGLDNAVRQAKERHFDNLFIFDADCHQSEPFVLFAKYLSEPWKKIFEKTDPTYDYEADPFLSGADGGIGKLQYRKTNASHPKEYYNFLKGRIIRPETNYLTSKTEPEELVQTFAKRMHDIGIKRSIVLPTSMLSLGFDPRPELEVALANAYIDYMIDNFIGKYPEILTMIYTPGNSPEKAAELIDRVGPTRGIVGVMVTSGRSTLAGDPSWDVVYEAAQRNNLPVCFHGNPHFGGPFAGLDRFVSAHALSFPFYLILQLTSIVMSGVPERHPKLKFAFMEGGVSWIPWIKHRLDSEYVKRRSEAPFLTKLPSEYIDDFYFTTQPLENPITRADQAKIFKMFDSENRLMYASDYPHWDFDVPSVIYDIPFLSKKAKKKILGENAKRFFRMD